MRQPFDTLMASRPMALFEFELDRVEDIQPWGKPGDLSLSWFALTCGRFRINVGDQILFRYTDEIQRHWGMQTPDADYQIAAFTSDFIACVAPASVGSRLEDDHRLGFARAVASRLHEGEGEDDRDAHARHAVPSGAHGDLR
jgi:hypothetical protein